jgi:hypothetical protein
MSIYLFDCFSARLSRFLCQRHTFGQKWTCLYSIDSAAESIDSYASTTYLGILVQAQVPYCPGSVNIPSHSDIIWPCNSL